MLTINCKNLKPISNPRVWMARVRLFTVGVLYLNLAGFLQYERIIRARVHYADENGCACQPGPVVWFKRFLAHRAGSVLNAAAVYMKRSLLLALLIRTVLLARYGRCRSLGGLCDFATRLIRTIIISFVQQQ